MKSNPCGDKLHTKSAALLAWTKNKNKNNLEIVFYRKGKRHTLNYRVS